MNKHRKYSFAHFRLFVFTTFQSWNPIAAKQAQSYADKCIFLQHNDPLENTIPYLGSCGQNLFVAAQKTPWLVLLLYTYEGTFSNIIVIV